MISIDDFKGQMKPQFAKIRIPCNSEVAEDTIDISEIEKHECIRSWGEMPKRTTDFFSNTNTYLYRNTAPYEGPKKNGLWSPEETDLLIEVIQNGVAQKADYISSDGQVKWGLLSLMIKGRVGYQCYNRYKILVESAKIDEITDLIRMQSNPSMRFDEFTQPALLPDQEDILNFYINDMIDAHEDLKTAIIKTQAICLYYDPLHLARKAIINDLIQKGLPFMDINGEYVQEVESPDDSILAFAEERPHELMLQYRIPDFCASAAWVSRFMDKHDFVFRQCHFRRRGNVDPVYVERFLNALQNAIDNFPPDRILNMDETHVLLDYSLGKTIARKGQDEVVVEKDIIDQKGGTTYIATIAMDPGKKIPLYCIAKGKSSGCEEKYCNDNPDKCQMDHSLTGWCTGPLMTRYIPWLHKLMGEKSFVLIMDLYKAHQSVLELCRTLDITVIFVPANGTGKYQPLDRKIFGIIKKRLASKEALYPIEEELTTGKHKEMYKIMHKRFLHEWDQLGPNAINAAWNILGEARGIQIEEQ